MDHVGHCALLGPVVWVLDPIAKLFGPRKGKNQTEHLEIKNIINQIRNSMDGLLSRLDRAQKKISDSEITYPAD